MSSTSSNSQRAYALIDGDNFYVSCERVFNAASRQQPVVVLSNNDGCIISRSREVKALGIPMGAPLHQVRYQLERHGVRVFSANFELYGDLSDRMIETLETFTDQVEVYSIDEAFVYLEESLRSLARLAQEMRTSVYRWTGLPVTVGVGPTKTLAKVAAEYGKRDTTGTRLLMDPGDIEAALRQMPVGEVWGVGHRLVERLRGWGIHTAWDLTQMRDPRFLTRQNVMVRRTQAELCGVPCFGMEDSPDPKQSIISSRSFGQLATQKRLLQEAIAHHAARLAAKLHAAGQHATALTVMIRTNSFRPDEPQYRAHTTQLLPYPTHYAPHLVKTAMVALEALYKVGFRYHKAGVMVAGLSDQNVVQTNLLAGREDEERHHRLMTAMAKVNHQWGLNTVQLAAEGFERPWRMRQEHCSPRYTTRWEDLLVVS
jgi:DNA polymerase V